MSHQAEGMRPETDMACDLCHRTGDNQHFVRVLCPECTGLNPAAFQECVEALKHSLQVHLDLMKAYDKSTVESMDASEAVSIIRQALAHAQGKR